MAMMWSYECGHVILPQTSPFIMSSTNWSHLVDGKIKLLSKVMNAYNITAPHWFNLNYKQKKRGYNDSASAAIIWSQSLQWRNL